MSTVVVCGSIAQRPGRPGHAIALLAYAIGLRQLGYEPLFLDRLDPACTGRSHTQGSAARSKEGRWLAAAMSAAGLQGRYAALLGGRDTLGMPRGKLLDEVGRSALLLNVNGFLEDEELLAAASRRVYLDIDPGFAQFWEAQGLPHSLAGHDDFVTLATNIGAADCLLPSDGREWIATLPPVPLDCWPPSAPGSAFTSIGSWRGPFAPIEHDGVRYGLRAHELRRFLTLPDRVAAPFELALEIDPEDDRDLAALSESSWNLIDPSRSLASFSDYRRYLQRSMAEISIAKGIYVGTRGGWFSDRSACYMASGKPVLAQATGLSEALPTGRGLVCFEDLEQAAQAAEELRGNLALHSVAAREIAEEHLDSRVVLRRMLERIGVG